MKGRTAIWAMIVTIVIILMANRMIRWTPTVEQTDLTTSSGPVEISGGYTFQDPEGLDYDARYVVYSGEESTVVSTSEVEGVQALYSIVYAKDNQPVTSFDYFVCDTPEHAQDLLAFYEANGATLTVVEEDPAVLFSTTDGPTLKEAMDTCLKNAMIRESTVTAYVALYASSVGGVTLR